MAEMADDAKIIETVVRAHFDSCEYTADKIKPFIAKAQAEKQFTQCTGMVSTFNVHVQLTLVSFVTGIYFCCFNVHKSYHNLLKPC